MKRVQAACICQTLHFFQKDEISKERNAKYSQEELEKYKQYNNSPVGDYLK